MTKRSVILKGDPIINEEGVAGATVKPGYLVKGVSTILHQTGTGRVPCAVALERDELGAGIDNAHQGSGTGSAFYASGDTVKIGVFSAGEEFTGFVASGENISEDALLESKGDGTLKAGTTTPVGRAKATIGLVAAVTALRVEAM